jgi:putative ABC transport system permease protein
VVLGLGTTFFTSKILSSVLFGVSATDPTTMALVPGVLMVAAIIACAVPARRAAKVDPAEVLREG